MKKNAPPKIFLIQQSSIFEQYGGIEYYLDDFCKAYLSSFGDTSLSVISPSRSKSPESMPLYPITHIEYPKNALWLKINNRIPMRLYQSTKKIISDFKPDYILCGHKSLSPLAFLLSRQYGIPYGTFAYGVEVWEKSFWHENTSFLNSDFLISISHFTRGQIPQYQKPVFVLHPCVSKEFENLAPVRSSPDTFRLLTVSRLSARDEYKGHRDVLAALHHLKEKQKLPNDLSYTILGNGEDKPLLMKTAERLGLSPIVHFIESVPTRSQLLEKYFSHDVFIMPSYFERNLKFGKGEGFGIVYVEAMACGKPCIAYEAGGALDIIESNKTGFLVPQGNITALADKILTYYNDRKLREAHGQLSYEKVKNDFVFSIFQEKVTQFFLGMEDFLKNTQRAHPHDVTVGGSLESGLQTH